MLDASKVDAKAMREANKKEQAVDDAEDSKATPKNKSDECAVLMVQRHCSTRIICTRIDDIASEVAWNDKYDLTKNLEESAVSLEHDQEEVVAWDKLLTERKKQVKKAAETLGDTYAQHERKKEKKQPPATNSPGKRNQPGSSTTPALDRLAKKRKREEEEDKRKKE